MPGRAADLIKIPDSLWRRAEMIEALRKRDIGQVFGLVRQYAGASQTRLAIAYGMTQGKVSRIMAGKQLVMKLEVFERIADGLNMPDHACAALGVAPHTSPVTAHPVPLEHPGSRDAAIRPRNTRPALDASTVSDLLSADLGDGEEDEDSVQRRTFVGLTGASLFGAVLADTARGGLADSIESFAAVLAAYSPDTPGGALDTPPDIAALAAAVARAKRDYQACRYSDVVKDLPALLTRLQAACSVLDGDARLQACTLSAEAHHVAPVSSRTP